MAEIQQKSVWKNYKALFQRRAVLWPMGRKKCFTDNEVIAKVNKLRRLLKKKVISLKELGYKELQGERFTSILRCPVAFMTTDASLKYKTCQMFHLCPWCYTRYISQYYDKFADLLPKRGKLTDTSITLLEISNQRFLEPSYGDIHLPDSFNTIQRAVKGLLSRIEPLGAFYTLSLEPYNSKEHGLVYLASYRILCLIADDFQIPLTLTESDRVIKLHKVQKRRQLITILGRICRYSSGLLLGDSRMTIACLEARRGRKCNNLVGCFRKNSKGLGKDRANPQRSKIGQEMLENTG